MVAPLEKSESSRYALCVQAYFFCSLLSLVPAADAAAELLQIVSLRFAAHCMPLPPLLRVLCGGGTRGDFSDGSHLHEKYDWHESQIFRLLPFAVQSVRDLYVTKKRLP